MRKTVIILALVAVLLLGAQSVFASEPNPHVTIVNPVHERTLFSDNLLVSVKLTQPQTIGVTVTQITKIISGQNVAMTLEEYQRSQSSDSRLEVNRTVFANLESFSSENNLSFYTKKIENVPPGVYIITVNTLDAEGMVANIDRSVVSLKAKEENPVEQVSLAPQPSASGPTLFLKNLLKSIFGD